MNFSKDETIPLVELDFSAIADKKISLGLAIDSLVDTAGEAWFILGERIAERKFLDILDKLEKSLLDSEEDAIMTIHLIRKMVENDERE
jgi:hypothetical protein